MNKNICKNEYWKDKRVLITGASGFVGSHFLHEIMELAEVSIGTSFNNVNDRTLRTNLLDLEGLIKICKDFNFDVLIHCAALDGNSNFKSKNLVPVMDENMAMTRNVLTASRLTGIHNVVLVSSAEIYASEVISPIAEDFDYRKNFPINGNGYVYAKIFSEIMAKMYRQQYGMNIYIARPTNIYGPGDNFHDGVSKVIPSMIKNALSNQPIEIWGDGSQIRDFIFIKDMVSLVLNMVSEDRTNLLNISTAQAISIKELAEMVISISGSRSEINLLKNKPIGVLSRILDITNASGFIDFPPTTIFEGLRETIGWFRTRGV